MTTKTKPKLFKVNFDFDKWHDICIDGKILVADTNAIRIASQEPILLETDAKLNEVKEVLERCGLGEVLDIVSSYVFMETQAPAAYDGFSTIEISAREKCSDELIDKPVRIVATENRDLLWQQGRYGSGMYYFKEI